MLLDNADRTENEKVTTARYPLDAEVNQVDDVGANVLLLSANSGTPVSGTDL